MEFNIIWIDSLYDNCKDLAEENIVEKKIEKIKTLSETDNRILMDDQSIVTKGDLREEFKLNFNLDVVQKPLIDHLFNVTSSDDHVEINSLTIYKSKCLENLEHNLSIKEIFTMKILDYAFSQNDIGIIYKELIDYQFKFALLDEIQELQKSVLDNRPVEWV